ncbi:MAG: hypothetical protein ACRDKL_10575 [Solirubrobacteraceae bacterium]
MQAGVVAAPRVLAPRWASRVARLRGRGWALVPVASIIGVIFLIRFASGTADWLTYLALVAVPLLCALALGWLMRGARPWLALLAAGLFVLAWRAPGSLFGEAAAAVLSGLSCVALGVLLASVTPRRWLVVGIVAMACADVWLTTTNLLQAPNNLLTAAAPGGGLPQLQSEQFGGVTMGYGDLFVASLLGGVFAARWPLQWRAALLTLVCASLFDLLFLVVDDLPATVPVAVALLLMGLGSRSGRRVGGRVGRFSGRFGRLRRAGGIPPPAT